MSEQDEYSSTSYARTLGVTSLHERRRELERQFQELAQEFEAGGSLGEDALSTALQQINEALQAMSCAESELLARTQQLAESHSECDRERQRYLDLFQLCPDPYLVTNSRGKISEANRAAGEMAGCPSGELVGMAIQELVHPDEREAFEGRISEINRLSRIDGWEVRLHLDDSKTVPVAVTVIPSDHDNRHGDLRWLLRDLTAIEQDRLDMQRMRDEIHRSERLTAIGTLAAGLGHDVKNLLLPMRCRLDSLSSLELPAQARQDVEGLRHAVGYLQQLANNLQLMAERPDPTQPELSRTELIAWWEHVAPLMRTATRTNVHISAQLDDGIPSLAIAPHLLTQVVMNLINNASEVMPEGGRVSVWAKRSKHGPFVKLGVSDDGPGMPAEVLRKALDPFFTTKPRGRGLSTGMGLSLVRSILKSVAGSVRIDSTPGQGTTVILRLPIASDQRISVSGSASGVAHAAVSISDSHLASTMCTLLNLSRLPSWRCDPHDPGDCALWVVEPQSIAIALAREFLTDRKRRLVLFGHQTDQWNQIDAIWLDPTSSLATIRDVLSQAALDVLQSQ